MTIIRRSSILANNVLRAQNLLLALGGLVCLYGLAVLIYVQLVPDLGLRSAFDTTLKATPRLYFDGESPQAGDQVVRIGDKQIRGWADLLHAPFELQAQNRDPLPMWLERRRVNEDEILVAKVWFRG